MLWFGESVENPEMTFPIKKRINTESVIGRMVALYIIQRHIKGEINEGDQPAAQGSWTVRYTFH